MNWWKDIRNDQLRIEKSIATYRVDCDLDLIDGGHFLVKSYEAQDGKFRAITDFRFRRKLTFWQFLTRVKRETIVFEAKDFTEEKSALDCLLKQVSHFLSRSDFNAYKFEYLSCEEF